MIGSASCLEPMKTPSRPTRGRPANRRAPPLLRDRLQTKADTRPGGPTRKPALGSPMLQKEMNKVPAKLDKSLLTDRQQPPSPRETQVPAMKTERPDPATPSSFKKPERAPDPLGNRPSTGRWEQRFLLRRPGAKPTHPPGGWRKRPVLVKPVSRKNPEGLPAMQGGAPPASRKALPFLPGMPEKPRFPASPARAKNPGVTSNRQGRRPPEN